MSAKASAILFTLGVVIVMLLIAAEPVALAVGRVAGPLVISLSLVMALPAGICVVGFSWLLRERIKSQGAARRLTEAETAIKEAEAAVKEAEAAVKDAEARLKQAEADKLRLAGEVYVIQAPFDEQVFIGHLKRGFWRTPPSTRVTTPTARPANRPARSRRRPGPGGITCRLPGSRRSQAEPYP